MAKILLVEDDKSLREIYGVRLMAEGYEIVSAGDGEEALAMAIKEKPDLIVSDVMMPKISGFDMLDILRSTTETKGVKVIMMTALSSDDQRARGEALGADRYLVKSQVGIEDVVRTVHEVLADGGALGAAPATPNPFAATEPVTAVPVPSDASAPATDPAIAPMPVPADPTPLDPAPMTPAAPDDTAAPVEPAASPMPMPDPIDMAPPAPEPASAPADPMTPAPAPVEPAPVEPPAEPAPAPEPTPAPAPAAPQLAPLPPVINATTVIPRAPTPAPAPAPQPEVQPSTLPEPTAPFSTPRPGSVGDRVINPLSPEEGGAPDMATLMNQELSSAGVPPPPEPPVPPTPPVPPLPGQPTT